MRIIYIYIYLKESKTNKQQQKKAVIKALGAL